MIVLGPHSVFLTQVSTVDNLYRVTHTTSCKKSLGSISNPSDSPLRADAERDFVVRVKVEENSQDGSLLAYDFSGMEDGLKAYVLKKYEYHEGPPSPDEIDVSVVSPSRLGLIYFNVSSSLELEEGTYTVEIVREYTEVSVDKVSTICKFGLVLS